MSRKVSVKSVANRIQKANDQAAETAKTKDSFQNFALSLGIGTDNAMTVSTYGYNPVTLIRILLEWIHRGSWLGGMAVDLVADDMTRAGIEFHATLKPELIEELNAALVRLDIWGKLNETIKWARLYGGCIAVMLIDGQNVSSPLSPDRIGKGAFKGLYVLDRWMVNASVEDLVQEFGPNLGMPKFYTVVTDTTALRGAKIHYSRIIRLNGVSLPYWQKVSNNLWDLSVIERLYDRMIAFDSATTGVAQSVYKSFLRTLKIKGLREAIAVGGPSFDAVVLQVQTMRRFQSNEAISLIDIEDEFQTDQNTTFTGMGDALLQLGQQISGALQIPLVRMFGQSPAGLNSTGESDLVTYYDGINQQQEKQLRVPFQTILKLIALSEGIVLPDGFNFDFASLWQLDDEKKATVAKTVADAVIGTYEAGITDRATALNELRQSSRVTGIFSNITDEDIEDAESEPPISEQTELELQAAAGAAPGGEEGGGPSSTGDRARIFDFHGLPVRIETAKGEKRGSFAQPMAADYGYFEGTSSAEGHHEGMDCFIGPEPSRSQVYVIDQKNLDTGGFDEHKVMCGFPDSAAAIEAYRASYDNLGTARIGHVTEMQIDAFKDWLKTGNVRMPVGMAT